MAGNQIQQGGLAEAVATDDADAVPFDKIVGEIPDQMPIPVALAQVGYFQNFATQRPTCSVQFQFAGHLTVGDFVLDFVELIDAGFGLSPLALGCLRIHSNSLRNQALALCASAVSICSLVSLFSRKEA